MVIAMTCLLIFINLTYRTKAEDISDMADNTILSDLIKSEYSEFEEDEELIMETFDSEAVISATQQSYLDKLGTLKPQPQATISDIEEEEQAELSTIQGGAIVKQDMASTRITKRPRTGNINYTVLPGDTVSTIAEQFDISVSTILWENSLSAYSIIRPGDQLVILPTTGVTHTVAKGENLANIAMKYNVGENVVLETNKLASASNLQIGQKLLIPNGRKLEYASYKPVRVSGLSAIRDFVSSPNAKPKAGNKMNWPTAGARITQYFSWRHYAVDIANKIGTPIYAADSGTIEYVGWGKGYGNQILINHGGGKKTRYAHLSKAFVKSGQEVSKGQNIGAMGSTGWSTGSHLHFEVIINGAKYNPLNYIK
jgi:murein DD-endopeptidase MepM/ murein hydrolase activator NlpD